MRRTWGREASLAAASRSIDVSIRSEGDALDNFQTAARKLAEKDARKAYVRAIDHTGRRAQTAVVRALSKQVGLPQGRLKKLGRVAYNSARYTSGKEPQGEIKSTGRFLPLSEFKPKQFRKGAKASPWGRRELFEGSFMFAGRFNSNRQMPGGRVYFNSGRFNPKSGRNNLPLPMWGPAVPREMVQGDSATAFQERAKDLRQRVAHEVRALTKGVVT